MQVRYWLGKNWWNKGYMTEALFKVMNYLFTEVGINRLEGSCDSRNFRSKSVMEKCGMVLEGSLIERTYQ